MTSKDDQLIEALSEKVHIGWMQEKQRQGFADHVLISCWVDKSQQLGACTHPHGPSACHSNYCEIPPDQHHDDMLPYAELPEHIKEYDRATVRAVLGALSDLGYAISQQEATPIDPRHAGSADGGRAQDEEMPADSPALVTSAANDNGPDR